MKKATHFGHKLVSARKQIERDRMDSRQGKTPTNRQERRAALKELKRSKKGTKQ